MKVVFVAFLKSPSASGHQRLWALRECGMDVHVLDKDGYKNFLGRFAGKVAKLLKNPKLLSNTVRLEQDLIDLCIKEQPDLIWMEWAKEFQSQTILKIKKLLPNAIWVSMQDDNPWGDRKSDQWMWKDYFEIVPQFDVHIVKRESDVIHLKALGAKEMYMWEHGMYSPLFYPAVKKIIPKKYPVSFVGTCMDNRVELISFLLEKGIPMHVFGTRWDTRSDLPKKFPTQFHAAVEGEQYANVIRDSQICLGLVSHSNHDEWTMRSYEVPACGVLLLAERTPTHEALFTEDVNAAFFSTKEECAEKLLHLVNRPELCEQMGNTAFEMFNRLNYGIQFRMQDLIGKLKNKI
ncbi:glycosyltransferase [Cytophaga aurantiaca]|uniref:glycosyltransferase family protein n=1 Tax=Cytophaga aurantiaca TaxID=29530 RepID=UPI00036B6925|nr:glycosyltransferase [Cytophaga aurantiaca]